MKINFLDRTEPSFCATRDYITKSAVRAARNNACDVSSIINHVNVLVTAERNLKQVNELISRFGITEIHPALQKISILTERGVKCVLPFPVSFDFYKGKNIVANELSSRTIGPYFLGLPNFLNCVNDLKRFDIFKKGLDLHTEEFDIVSDETKKFMSQKLSHHLKRIVTPQKMFYIDGECYYYDSAEKTVYSLGNNTFKIRKPNVKSCKFIMNDEGCAIGYETKKYDILKNKMINYRYVEQQHPSYELPKVVSTGNRKELAEAFRFGNMKSDEMPDDVKSKILFDLDYKTQIEKSNKDKITQVRIRQNGVEQTRYSYYDSGLNTSFVYNKDGDFLYQLRYIYDDEGNITSFYKI